MPKDSAKGQSKEHKIFYFDGTPVLNEDGTQMTMTQAEWRARDKGLGYTRFEDDATEEAAEAPAEDAPAVETPAETPPAEGTTTEG